MARMVRETKLETRNARLKLEKGKRYWKSLDTGLAIGYRRTADGYGVWMFRMMNPDRETYTYKSIARADDNHDADGEEVLTFSQAQEKARSLAKETKAVGPEIGKLPTVTEAATHYLAWFKEHRKSYRETETTVNAHVIPAFGDHLVTDLTTKMIRQWHERIAIHPARKRTSIHSTKQAFREKAVTGDQKRARKSTANRILTVLKAILNKAFQDGMVSDDTAWRRVKPFENADEPVTRFLTEAESTRLVNACQPDFRPLVKAALFTGCRYGELTRLLTKSVNLDTNMIYITPEAKSGKGRYVPLSADGLDFFRTNTLGKVGSDHVFTRSDGAPWGKNHNVRLLKAACKQGKIEPEIGFHELRHTYASMLAQKGVDLLTISKLLGHADTRITSRHYAHLCDNTLKVAVAKLPGFGHQTQEKVRELRR
jgi:integrase